MGIVVQKFGGRLLESPTKIRRAAHYIINSKLAGDDPVVVVSAPGRATDHLVRWAARVSDNPEGRELDMLLSVGERMAMALLALAINADGRFGAVSFTGSQVGIITDTRHTDASIIEVKGLRIREAIAKNQIPIIAGFQGISIDREITTLGRGGSDATAVALAVALKADHCELIKESGGIYSCDPLLDSTAQIQTEIDYSTLEDISQAGASVVQPRAATLAKEHKVVLSINAPDGIRGTLVVDRTLTRAAISTITLRKGVLHCQDIVDLPHTGFPDIFCWNCKELTSLSFNRKSDGTSVDVVTVVGWGGKLSQKAADMAISVARVSGLELLVVFRPVSSVLLAVAEGQGDALIKQLHLTAKNQELFDDTESEKNC